LDTPTLQVQSSANEKLAQKWQLLGCLAQEATLKANEEGELMMMNMQNND